MPCRVFLLTAPFLDCCVLREESECTFSALVSINSAGKLSTFFILFTKAYNKDTKKLKYLQLLVLNQATRKINRGQ